MSHIRTAIAAFADMCEAFGAWLLEDPWQKLWKLVVVYACVFLIGLWIMLAAQVAVNEPLAGAMFLAAPLIVASWSFGGGR